MRLSLLALLAVVASAVTDCSSSSGQAQCEAAGGQCVLGGNFCANPMYQYDCNPDRNPGGAYCCAPCHAGTVPDDAGTACVGAE
jgi:hypothetical protein